MRSSLFLLCLVLGACRAPGFQPHQLEHHQIHRILTTCEEMRTQYATDKQAVDCRVWDLVRLHLSFPNIQTYNQLSQGISVMVQTWCFAARPLAEGRTVFYSWDFREERQSYSRRCPPPAAKEE